MKKILTAVVIVTIFCFSVAAQTTLLKMNPEKNKIYTLRSVSEQTITQTVNGIQQTTETKVDYVMSMKMIDLASDFMIAEIRFDTLITTSNAMGKQTKINSAVEGNLKSSEASDIMSCIMNRLSKNAVFSKIDFTGQPLEIINSKMLADIILRDTGSITLTGPTAAAIKSQIAGTVSDNNLKTMIGAFTWYLPGKDVRSGDEWTHSQSISSGGMSLDIKSVYHLEGIKGDIANVSAESSIKPADNAAPIQSGGATVTYDNLQGVSKSNLIINIHTGLLIEETGKSHIAGELGISGPGFSMKMPMDINSESKVTVLH